MHQLLRAIHEDATDWARGRLWQWRLPLLVYLGYTGFRYLGDPSYWSVWSGITLGIHELGHVLFSAFGEFMTVAGGSLSQLAAPIVAGALLARQRDYFGAAVCAAWLSFSLCGLATYVADARTEELPLVSLSGEAEHDWTYLLFRTGLLRQDETIARAMRGAAAVVLVAALAAGAHLCLVMGRTRPAQE